MSEGSELWGGAARGVGRGAGRGTAEASTGGGREDSACSLEPGAWELDGFKPSGFDLDGATEGLGVFAASVLAASVFSARFVFGFSSSDFGFFFDGLFFVPGASVAFAFGFGVGSSSSSPDFLPGDFVAFGFGVGDSSSSSPLEAFFAFGFGVGDSSSSEAGVFFAFGCGVGVGVFFDFDFRVAGLGFALGSGVAEGVGDATARISSRAFFFFSSVDCARTNTATSATKAKVVPKKTRSRITGRERNRGDCAIKRAVAPLPRPAARVRVRAAGSRSIFRRGGGEDR